MHGQIWMPFSSRKCQKYGHFFVEREETNNKKLRMMLYCFLLLTSAGSTNSVRRDTIRGKAVTLFSNIDIGNNDNEVTLYKNESILIATWTWKNGPIEVVNMNPDYTGRIDMDRSKNIWIFDVDVTDAGKYWIKCIRTDKGIEVELNISEKKLTEEEMKNWLDDHQGFIEKYLGNLTDEVGKEVSKWLEDHPGFFHKLFDSSGLELYFIMITILIVTILLVEPLRKLLAVVCTVLKSLWCRKLMLKDDQVHQWLNDHPDFMEKYLETLKEDQVQQWLNDHPDFMEKYLVMLKDDQVHQWLNDHPDFMEKYLETLKEDQVQQWLNDHPDFMEKYLGNLTEDQIREPIQKWQNVYPGLFSAKFLETLKEDQVHQWLSDHPDFMDKGLDPKHIAVEATTKHRGSHYSELREKGPDVDHCAVCSKENVAMFVIPCEHVGRWYRPMCTKCGIASKPCGLCSASVKKNMEHAAWKTLK